MKIEMSYFVKVPHGDLLINVWLSAGQKIPEDAVVMEERPMLMPDLGKVLRHKETGEESTGHWLRNGDSAGKWEEVPETKKGE